MLSRRGQTGSCPCSARHGCSSAGVQHLVPGEAGDGHGRAGSILPRPQQLQGAGLGLTVHPLLLTPSRSLSAWCTSPPQDGRRSQSSCTGSILPRPQQLQGAGLGLTVHPLLLTPSRSLSALRTGKCTRVCCEQPREAAISQGLMVVGGNDSSSSRLVALRSYPTWHAALVSRC